MFRIYCPADFDYAHIVRDAGATLYAEADGVPFPSREWRDLPISVLTMWCEELRRSAGSASAAFSLCFMDGPYCIECQKDRDRVSMQFTEDEKPLFFCVLPFDELKTAVYAAAAELLSALDRHGAAKRRGVSGLKKALKRSKRPAVFRLFRKMTGRSGAWR